MHIQMSILKCIDCLLCMCMCWCVYGGARAGVCLKITGRLALRMRLPTTKENEQEIKENRILGVRDTNVGIKREREREREGGWGREKGVRVEGTMVSLHWNLV